MISKTAEREIPCAELTEYVVVGIVEKEPLIFPSESAQKPS